MLHWFVSEQFIDQVDDLRSCFLDQIGKSNCEVDPLLRVATADVDAVGCAGVPVEAAGAAVDVGGGFSFGLAD